MLSWEVRAETSLEVVHISLEQKGGGTGQLDPQWLPTSSVFLSLYFPLSSHGKDICKFSLHPEAFPPLLQFAG